MSVAFGQASELVRAIRADELGAYARAHRRLARMPRLVTSLLLEAERRPPLRRAMIRSFASSPRLFSRLVGVVGGAGLTADSRRFAAAVS
jgi:hypothetical protein